MMEQKQLRQADFAMGIGFVLFGLWIVGQAAGMPRTASFGDVSNVWYVSPALLPFIIGGCVTILGAVLLTQAVISGGARDFIASVKRFRPKITEKGLRFSAIVVALIAYVYLLVPHVDFYVATLLFLAFTTLTFYFEDEAYLRTSFVTFLIVCAVLAVLFFGGLAAALNAAFAYTTDVIALLAAIVMLVLGRRAARQIEHGVRKFRLAALLSVVVPFVITPLFRFVLLVRLPNEGGIVDLMGLIYFSLR